MNSRNIDTNTTWIRSSRCGPNHNCVELGLGDAEVIIRDSKSGGPAILIFRLASWSAFVQSCRSAF